MPALQIRNEGNSARNLVEFACKKNLKTLTSLKRVASTTKA